MWLMMMTAVNGDDVDDNKCHGIMSVTTILTTMMSTTTHSDNFTNKDDDHDYTP